MSVDIVVQDHRLAGPAGVIFARRWSYPASAPNLPALLLFHESLGCVDVWRDFPERLALATSLPVIAYDRSGFGRSDTHVGPLTPDFMAREAAETVPCLIEQLTIGPFIALGHSAGGGIAIETGAAFQSQCLGVISLAAQAYVDQQIREGIAAAKASFSDEAEFRRLVRHHGEKAGWVLRSWTEMWLSEAFASWQAGSALKALRCPLLILHGDRDEYSSSAHPHYLARHAAGSHKMILLENCGHVPHREYPDITTDLVARFVRTILTSAGPAECQIF